jgi:Ca2+-binding RTX toxin-like protein
MKRESRVHVRRRQHERIVALVIPIAAMTAVGPAASMAAATGVEATFNGGVLVVTGTDTADDIVVGAVKRTGALRVTNHGKTVPVVAVSGSSTKAALSLLIVSAGAGGDRVTLAASLANGSNTASGVVLGYEGPDILSANVGNTVLDGGDGNDVLRSGRGDDHLKGGAGNDMLTWVAGAGNDHVDGGAGTDTLVAGGSGLGDRFVLGKSRRVIDAVQVARTNVKPSFSVICDVERLSVFTRGGDDRLTMSSLVGTDASLVTVDAGAGNDVVAAGDGSVRTWLSGGDGNDTLTGGRFADTLNAGSGNDVIAGHGGLDLIDAGPGNDAINGGGNADDLTGGPGNDTLDGGGVDGASDELSGGPGGDRFARFRGEHDVFTDFNADQGDVVI